MNLIQNSSKNEFKDNNEKSCSWSRIWVPHKIYFKGVWPRNGHADSVGVNSATVGPIFFCPIVICYKIWVTNSFIDRENIQKYVHTSPWCIEHLLSGACDRLSKFTRWVTLKNMKRRWLHYRVKMNFGRRKTKTGPLDMVKWEKTARFGHKVLSRVDWD